jgi:hypothetical protein
LDSGASRTYFNNRNILKNFKEVTNNIMLGDNSNIISLGIGTYGLLKEVAYVPDLRINLLSTKSLCIDNDFLIVIDKKRALIVNELALNNGDVDNIIVATASFYEDDNLYHVDDMNKFLTYDHKDYNINNDDTYNCNISIKKALSNAQIKYKATTSNLYQLEVLHVKLGHAPEHVIKRILKFNMLEGLPYTFDDIKDEHLGLCYSCMKGCMKAFPIPSSVDKKRWSIFEYITVDIIPGNFKSIRGYKYMSLFVDKTTSMTFPKLMK